MLDWFAKLFSGQPWFGNAFCLVTAISSVNQMSAGDHERECEHVKTNRETASEQPLTSSQLLVCTVISRLTFARVIISLTKKPVLWR